MIQVQIKETLFIGKISKVLKIDNFSVNLANISKSHFELGHTNQNKPKADDIVVQQ